jgi:hypothetical protein
MKYQEKQDKILASIFQELSSEFFNAMMQHNFSLNALSVDDDCGYLGCDLI